MNRNAFSKRFPTYVISLERTPARLNRFLSWNRPADIDFKTFKAVDGATLDLSSIDPSILAPGTPGVSQGSMGATLSHRSLWQLCAKGSKPFMIFEDDTVARHDMKQALAALMDHLPDDWDLLYLGYNMDAVVEVALADDVNMRLGFAPRYPEERDLMRFAGTHWPVGMVPVSIAFGVCAYLISPKGAGQLLKSCFPLDSRIVALSPTEAVKAVIIDIRVIASLRFLRAFACVPPLAMPDNAPARSVRLGTQN